MQRFSCELTFRDLARELAIPVEIRSYRCRKYPLAVKNCIGIIDTGATSSMLTETIARELDLIPSGNITVSGVHGTENANMYEVDIIFGNRCILRDMPVSGANGDAGFDLLIGMDILSKGELYLSNENGKTVFRFGIPFISDSFSDSY